MSFDLDAYLPKLYVYLAGCSAVVALMLIKYALAASLDWFRQGGILRKNLKKIIEPDEETFREKATTFLVMGLIEAAFSWLAVIFELWHLASLLFQNIREVLVDAPEEIRLLRFPLRYNPDMSREAVWAYTRALEVKNGWYPTENGLSNSLGEVWGYHPSFDRDLALSQLKSLNVASPEVIHALQGR